MDLEIMIPEVVDMHSRNPLGTNCIPDVSGRVGFVPVQLRKKYLSSE